MRRQPKPRYRALALGLLVAGLASLVPTVRTIACRKCGWSESFARPH